MSDQPDPPATQPGSVNLNANRDMTIGGDVVGRDKIVQNIYQRPEAKPEPKFLVPFPQNKNFVGRDDDLTALHAALKKGEAVGVRPAMLTGLGGVGKTQLAVEYAYRFRGEYPSGVYWINAAQDWQDELAARAEEVGLRADDAPESDRRRRLVLTFADFLNAHPDALIIFDNVEDPRLLRTPAPGFIPTELKCRLLFTTRRRDPDLPFASIEVKVLPEPAALELLLSQRPTPHAPLSTELEVARAICRSLGYLPLALTLAAAYLGKYPKITLSGYRKRVEKEGGLATVDASGVDALDLPTRHDAAVAATLKSQWDALESDDAQRVLKTASLLGEAAQIPRARLALLTSLSDEAEEGYPAPLDEALVALRDLSLIEELTEHEILLHPLVGKFAENTIPDRGAFAEACAARLADTLWDMARLHDEVKARGIDAVLVDLRAALALTSTLSQKERESDSPLPAGDESPEARRSGKGPRVRERLTSLLRPLDREAHHLRERDAEQPPGFFLQQFRNCCLELSLTELQESAEAELVEQGWPYLHERFKTVRVSEALVRTLVGHTGPLNSVRVTPDGRFAISASEDGTLKVWDLNTGQAIQTLRGHTNPVKGVAIVRGGRFAISVSKEGTRKIWDLTTGQEARPPGGHEPLSRFDFVPDVSAAQTPDALISVEPNDYIIRVREWTANQFYSIDSVLRGHTGLVRDVAITPDGNFAVSASEDGTLKVWDLSKRWTHQDLEDQTDLPSTVAVTSDGRFAIAAAAGSSLETLQVWDLSTRQSVKALEGRTFSLEGLAVTPDNRFVISSDGHKLTVWDLASGTARAIKAYIGSVSILAVTPNFRFLVSASNDHALRVWDMAKGQNVQILEGHLGKVTGVVATPDNRFVISVSLDRTIKIWDLVTGQLFITLTAEAPLVSCALAPDGRTIGSRDVTDAVHVWEWMRRD